MDENAGWWRRTDASLNDWMMRHRGPWWMPIALVSVIWLAVLALLQFTEGIEPRYSTSLFVGIAISVPAAIRGSLRERARSR